MRRLTAVFAGVPLLALLACGGTETPAPPASGPNTSSPAAPSGGAERPAAVLAFETPVSAPSAAGPSAATAGLSFRIPATWTTSTPSSNMRIAQARIPGSAGDGELAVFWFGVGGGGGVEANLQRWIGQVGVAAGTQPARESFETNGLRVTWIDVKGALLPSTMGTGPTTEQPGSRLYGAVVEGPGGPWFFKATGPDATMEAARADYIAMLRACRAGG